MEAIVGHLHTDGGIIYEVQWVGGGESDLFTEEGLANCPDLLGEYKAAHGL